MNIGGLQKMTLIDFPGVIAAVVFTQGCYFRCSYCHNPELVSQQKETTLQEEEVFSYLHDTKGFLDGVCITGGEPTLQKDLPEFIRKIRALGLRVKLDTNGTNPQMLRNLLQDKCLDYIAMDIKHNWEQYEQVVKIINPILLKNCEESFHLIQESHVDHEFRTTFFPGVLQEEDFLSIASHLKPGEKYFLQNIQRKKTLEPNMLGTEEISLSLVAEKIHLQFPTLEVQVR